MKPHLPPALFRSAMLDTARHVNVKAPLETADATFVAKLALAIVQQGHAPANAERVARSGWHGAQPLQRPQTDDRSADVHARPEPNETQPPVASPTRQTQVPKRSAPRDEALITRAVASDVHPPSALPGWVNPVAEVLPQVADHEVLRDGTAVARPHGDQLLAHETPAILPTPRAASSALPTEPLDEHSFVKVTPRPLSPLSVAPPPTLPVRDKPAPAPLNHTPLPAVAARVQETDSPLAAAIAVAPSPTSVAPHVPNRNALHEPAKAGLAPLAQTLQPLASHGLRPQTRAASAAPAQPVELAPHVPASTTPWEPAASVRSLSNVEGAAPLRTAPFIAQQEATMSTLQPGSSVPTAPNASDSAATSDRTAAQPQPRFVMPRPRRTPTPLPPPVATTLPPAVLGAPAPPLLAQASNADSPLNTSDAPPSVPSAPALVSHVVAPPQRQPYAPAPAVERIIEPQVNEETAPPAAAASPWFAQPVFASAPLPPTVPPQSAPTLSAPGYRHSAATLQPRDSLVVPPAASSPVTQAAPPLATREPSAVKPAAAAAPDSLAARAVPVAPPAPSVQRPHLINAAPVAPAAAAKTTAASVNSAPSVATAPVSQTSTFATQSTVATATAATVPAPVRATAPAPLAPSTPAAAAVKAGPSQAIERAPYTATPAGAPAPQVSRVQQSASVVRAPLPRTAPAEQNAPRTIASEHNAVRTAPANHNVTRTAPADHTAVNSTTADQRTTPAGHDAPIGAAQPTPATTNPVVAQPSVSHVASPSRARPVELQMPHAAPAAIRTSLPNEGWEAKPIETSKANPAPPPVFHASPSVAPDAPTTGQIVPTHQAKPAQPAAPHADDPRARHNVDHNLSVGTNAATVNAAAPVNNQTVLPPAAAPQPLQPVTAAPAKATALKHVALAPADMIELSQPNVDVANNEARVSMQTDAGALSLHVRVRQGVADVSADGQAAAQLGAHGRDLEAYLSKEGLTLGRFTVDDHRGASSGTSDRQRSSDPNARQDADENVGTGHAESPGERPVSGDTSRLRRSGRVHIKA